MASSLVASADRGCKDSTVNSFVAHVANGDHLAVADCIAKGEDLNQRDEHGRTPLHWAAQEGHTAVIWELIKHGADVNTVCALGFTPLMTAAGEGHDQVVCQLVQYGASARIVLKSSSQCTPLQMACAYGRFEVVRALVAHSDVEINYRNTDGLTALGFANRAKADDIAQYLAQNGAIL